MSNLHLKAVPPQARAIYRLLTKTGLLDAHEIGRQLHILPNTVYRSAKPLTAVGLVRKTDDYPARFAAVPAEAALSWYLLATARQFRKEFGITAKQSATVAAPTIVFIKDRDDLIVRTNRDTTQAQKSIDYIVSGLEVPDETVLVYRQAVARGVKVRKMVQRRGETAAHKLAEWRTNGIDVRYCPDLGTRMFIIDERIAYLTSYSTEQKQRAFGIRFEYPPLAALLRDLFEQYWADASL